MHHAAEQGGYDVLVIDSLSHAWTGKDGVLDQVEKAKARAKGGSTFSDGWKFASPLHTKLVDTILQSRIHIIATMRSKTKYILEENDRGRQVPRKVGMEMVQRDGMEYEFDIVGELDQDHRLVVTKSRIKSITDAVLDKPGREFGATIATWLAGGLAHDEYPAHIIAEHEEFDKQAQEALDEEAKQQTLLAIQDQLAAMAGNGPMAKIVKQTLCAQAFGQHIKSWDDVKELSSSELIVGLGLLQAKAQSDTKSDPKPAPATQVEAGKMPFTYYVTDPKGEYLTTVDADTKSCNCGAPNGSCTHIAAVELFLKAAS
jgi:hypothetical protein